MIQKHSIKIYKHKTSVSLENEFWNTLKDIASSQQKSIADIIADIDKNREDYNLSSAIRVFVLQYLQNKLNNNNL